MQNNQNKNLVLISDLGMQYPKETSKQKFRYGLYRCYCGNEFKTQTSSVKRQVTKSCGCLHKKNIKESNTKHNLRKHILYPTWANMMARCYNPNNKRYKDWGMRGIKVCDRWHNVTNFIEDMYPTYQEGLSIDRIDNNLGYYKENCRWIDKVIQNRNTRLLQVNNKSGYRGANWKKDVKKWMVQICVNLKKIHLGRFDNPYDGALAYDRYIIENNLEHTRNFPSI